MTHGIDVGPMWRVKRFDVCSDMLLHCPARNAKSVALKKSDVIMGSMGVSEELVTTWLRSKHA